MANTTPSSTPCPDCLGLGWTGVSRGKERYLFIFEREVIHQATCETCRGIGAFKKLTSANAI